MNRASRAYVCACMCVYACVSEGVVVAVGGHKGNKGLSSKNSTYHQACMGYQALVEELQLEGGGCRMYVAVM